jgi:peroxiredoxin
MKAHFLIFGFCFQMLNSIAGNGFTFTLKGSVKSADGSVLYIHHKWNDVYFKDSVIIRKSKINVKLQSEEPNLYWFSYASNPEAQPMCFFFCDPGEISVDIKSKDSIAYSAISGGTSQQVYMQYRIMQAQIVATQMTLQSAYQEAAQRADQTKMNQISQEFNNLNTHYLNSIKAFVKSNPSSPVSAYIIYTDLSHPSLPLSETQEAFSHLNTTALKNTKFYTLIESKINKAQGSTVGFKANDFKQNTPEGKSISLSDFKGKYVLLDFWASWCRPCRMENPNVVAAYQKFKDKGFTVLGISMDSNKEAWLNAIKQDQLTWTQVSDLKGWSNEVGQLYGVGSIPQNFLIGPDGIIIAKELRGSALEQKLSELFNK